MTAGAVISSEGLTGGGSASTLLHEVAGRIQFLAACWIEGLSSSRAGAGGCPRFLASGPLHRAVHTWQLASLGVNTALREGTNKAEVPDINNLLSEVSPSLLLHSLQ